MVTRRRGWLRGRTTSNSFLARGRCDFNLIADFLFSMLFCDGRRRGNEALLDVGLFGAHQLVFDLHVARVSRT